MKKITLKQTKIFKNSDLCIATEYDFGDKDIDVSTAEISGRYPDKGYCVNMEVKEMIFCLSGGGYLHTAKKKIPFQAGDAILIDKGEKYYWNAKCKVLMACTPAWFEKQHLLVD